MIFRDVDGDGDLDAIVMKGSALEPAPSELWLNTNGIFAFTGQSFISFITGKGAAGDVDGDGDPDIVLPHKSPNKVWLNDGAGNFTDSGQSLGNSESEVAVLADVDNDGDLDMLVGNSGPGEFAKLWLNEPACPLVTADCDGDGDVDGIDFSVFASCFNKAGNPPRTAGCPPAWLKLAKHVSPVVATRTGFSVGTGSKRTEFSVGTA